MLNNQNSSSLSPKITNIPLFIESNFPTFKFVNFIGQNVSNQIIVVQELSTKSFLTLRLLSNISRNIYYLLRKFFYTLEKLNHPNLIKYFQITYMKEESLAIIASQYGEIAFYHYMKGKKILDLEHLKQIIQGIKHLHVDVKIIHGNLKLSNLLMIDELVKIADFKNLRPEFDWSIFDLMEYYPPEVLLLKETKNINNKCDIWAIGIILYKLLVVGDQEHPFLPKNSYKLSNAEKMLILKENLSKNIKLIDLDLEINNNFYLELLEQCLQYDPTKRPDSLQLWNLISEFEDKNLNNVIKQNYEEEYKKNNPINYDSINANDNNNIPNNNNDNKMNNHVKIPMKSIVKALENFGIKNFDIEKTQYLYLSYQKPLFTNLEVLPLFSELLTLDYYDLLELNINGNDIGDLNRKCLEILFGGLKKNRSLQKLVMNSNHLGQSSADFKLFCNAIKTLRFLGSLIVSDNLIGIHPLNMKYLVEALLFNEELTILDLSINLLGKFSENMCFFWELLKDHKALTDLNLSRNDLGNYTDGIKLLSDGLKFSKSLKSLDLGTNKIAKELQSIDHLTYALKVNKQLEILSLSNNDIGNNIVGINMLAEVLCFTKNLIELNLSCNNLCKYTKSMKYLARALKENTSLNKLNLNGNKIGKDLASLCLNLVFNKTITHLILSDNCLGPDIEIVNVLAEYIQINENLQILDISSNQFGLENEGFRCLMEALKLNFTLKILFLNDIKLKEKVENLYVLATLLRTNNTFNSLYLLNNEITDIDEEKFLSEKGDIFIFR